MSTPFDDQTGQRIFAVIRDTDFQWRSPGGIARAAGLQLEDVQDYLDAHQEWFDRAPLSPGGIPLYTVQRRLRRAAATLDS